MHFSIHRRHKITRPKSLQKEGRLGDFVLLVAFLFTLVILLALSLSSYHKQLFSSVFRTLEALESGRTSKGNTGNAGKKPIRLRDLKKNKGGKTLSK